MTSAKILATSQRFAITISRYRIRSPPSSERSSTTKSMRSFTVTHSSHCFDTRNPRVDALTDRLKGDVKCRDGFSVWIVHIELTDLAQSKHLSRCTGITTHDLVPVGR